MDKRSAFGYYGGKFSHLNWLLPLLPKTIHYCEPFGGSASVLINREQSLIETYNDLNSDIVNFFRVLRNNYDELIRLIKLTPYSREEFSLSCEEVSCDITDVERARLFFVRIRQSRMSIPTCTKGQWSFSINIHSRGMSKCASRWFNTELSNVSERILKVQIENDSAFNVIKRYDTKDTLFYCDPPYVFDSRVSLNVYSHEMPDYDHLELSSLLHNVKGKVAISGYHCELMDGLYNDWNYLDSNVKNEKVETLWMNYDYKEHNQMEMF